MGARVKMYFSNTQSSMDDGAFTNSQLLIRLAPNQRGESQTLDNNYWQQIQAKKYITAYNGGKPIDLYMPLKQQNEVETSTGTTTTMVKPRFVSTSTTNALFEGINCSIERVDGQGFSSGSSNYQYCKVIYTLYFQCRGVA